MRKIIILVLLFGVFISNPLFAQKEQPLSVQVKELSQKKQKLEIKQSSLFSKIKKNEDTLKQELIYERGGESGLDYKIEKYRNKLSRSKLELSRLNDINDTSKEHFQKKENLSYDIEDIRDDISYSETKLTNIRDLKKQNIIDREKYELNSQILLEMINQLNELLNRVEVRNDFRLYISWSFIGLVAIVILGFYIIAFSNDGIAKNIFSGEKGIQFITLFLIIIAIILFGIMGTLESRELSALLGALSGYILGKTSVPTESLSDKMAEYNSILLKKENNLSKGNNDEKN